MARTKRRSKGKEIRPSYFVFCEGESEEAYIKLLRSIFRVPVEISAKIAKSNINRRYIDNVIKQKPQHAKDIVFLMYDIDVKGMLEKLTSIKDTVPLLSNPCFELWYILHFCNINSYISTEQCVDKAENIVKGYKKGEITPQLKEKLYDPSKAVERAKSKQLYNNPSTSIYKLIERLVSLTS